MVLSLRWWLPVVKNYGKSLYLTKTMEQQKGCVVLWLGGADFGADVSDLRMLPVCPKACSSSVMSPCG